MCLIRVCTWRIDTRYGSACGHSAVSSKMIIISKLHVDYAKADGLWALARPRAHYLHACEEWRYNIIGYHGYLLKIMKTNFRSHTRKTKFEKNGTDRLDHTPKIVGLIDSVTKVMFSKKIWRKCMLMCPTTLPLSQTANHSTAKTENVAPSVVSE